MLEHVRMNINTDNSVVKAGCARIADSSSVAGAFPVPMWIPLPKSRIIRPNKTPSYKVCRGLHPRLASKRTESRLRGYREAGLQGNPGPGGMGGAAQMTSTRQQHLGRHDSQFGRPCRHERDSAR
jgi:hypothetical protein